MILAETSNIYILDLQTLGLVAATAAAFFWAIAVVLYRRLGRVMPPVRLNLVKGLVASVLLGMVILIDWQLRDNEPWDMSRWMLVLMAISGIIGIGFGDSLMFAGLNRMGARRMLLLFTLNPVFTAVVAWLLLHEPLSLWQIIGIAMTISGVAWVIAERNSGKVDGHVDALGILFGIGAAICQAGGLLLSRYVFEQGEMTPSASAWLRITAGVFVLLLFLPLDRRLQDPGGEAHHHPTAPSRRQTWIMLGFGILLGTVLGIWLMQVAVKDAEHVGVASTLLSTSPLFVLPIVAMLGERVSMRAVLGAVTTMAGIALLYMMATTS